MESDMYTIYSLVWYTEKRYLRKNADLWYVVQIFQKYLLEFR